jgi:hypothetical protein
MSRVCKKRGCGTLLREGNRSQVCAACQEKEQWERFDLLEGGALLSPGKDDLHLLGYLKLPMTWEQLVQVAKEEGCAAQPNRWRRFGWARSVQGSLELLGILRREYEARAKKRERLLQDSARVRKLFSHLDP